MVECMYKKTCIEKGIVFIQDLLDEKGVLLRKEKLLQKNSINLAPLQYVGLLHAIPQE